jgi:hypothetical protein
MRVTIGINDRVVCATPLGIPLDVQLEHLDRFAKEVMPAFRPAKIAAAAECSALAGRKWRSIAALLPPSM